MSEVTFEPFQKVLVRAGDNKWVADFYSHYNNKNYPVVTTAGRVTTYEKVLPYNDETAHLLGTTDSPTPPEQDFKWGDHVEVRDNTSVEWRKAVYIKTVESDNFPYIVIVWDNSTDTTLNFKYRYCRHADW